MRKGVQQHIAEIKPSAVVATEPNSYAARELVKSLGIQTVPSDQFLCHPDEYSQFMGERRTIKMWETGKGEAVFTTSVGDRLVIDQGLVRVS